MFTSTIQYENIPPLDGCLQIQIKSYLPSLLLEFSSNEHKKILFPSSQFPLAHGKRNACADDQPNLLHSPPYSLKKNPVPRKSVISTKPQTQIEISTIYNSGERLARDSLIPHETGMSRLMSCLHMTMTIVFIQGLSGNSRPQRKLRTGRSEMHKKQ